MKAKHFLMIAVLSLMRMAEAQSTNDPSQKRMLAEAAVDAVKEWKYKPYTLNGEPVEFQTTIKIQFHL